MKITNNYGLPEAVYNFISEDRYNPGDSDYSVTTLLNPPQLVQLQRRHWNELEEDAMSRVWSVFGTAVHNLFEDHTKEGTAEERLYVEIDGVKVGGQMDHVKDGVITDYKVTSVYKVMKDTPKEWIEQQNIYALLQAERGTPVHKLQICAILRDWSRTKALQDRSYPQAPIQIIQLPLWPLEETQHFLEERVALHLTNSLVKDEALLPCTEEEMWAQPTTYALMKPEGKRATKVCSSLEEAAANLSGDLTIVERPGKRTRCQDYCPVKNFCSQYKEYIGGKD